MRRTCIPWGVSCLPQKRPRSLRIVESVDLFHLPSAERLLLVHGFHRPLYGSGGTKCKIHSHLMLVRMRQNLTVRETFSGHPYGRAFRIRAPSGHNLERCPPETLQSGAGASSASAHLDQRSQSLNGSASRAGSSEARRMSAVSTSL